MKKSVSRLALLALSASLLGASQALAHGGKAHVHGAGKMQVVVDGNELSIRIEAPLHDLVGFEHAPRSDRQRSAARQALDRFNQGETLFTPSSAAQCRLGSTRVEAPVLQGGQDTGDGHADLVAEYRFSCAQPARLTGMEVQLATHFPGLRRIDAEVVSARGQQATRLTPRMRMLAW